jgi:hypothetical protein
MTRRPDCGKAGVWNPAGLSVYMRCMLHKHTGRVKQEIVQRVQKGSDFLVQTAAEDGGRAR